MSDITVNLEQQAINVDIETTNINVDIDSQVFSFDIEDAQPIGVSIDDAQPIEVSLGEAVNYYGDGNPDLMDKHFTYQFTNSAEVTVPHELNKRPAVSIEDSAGDEVEAEVEYINLDSLLVRFSAPFTGRIICN